MLKTFLLASSMMIAVPALAQEVPQGDPTQQQVPTAPADQPMTTTDDAAPGTQGAGTAEEAEAPVTSPAPATEAAQPTPSAPVAEPAAPTTTPENPTAATTPTPETPDAATATAGTTGAGTAEPAATAAATPATTPDQVGQAVSREFANYDKDASGSLNRVEFDAWMVTLRSASEPSFNAGSAEAATWLTNAFAASDTDKSQSVSNVELTTFLTPKAQ